MGALQCNCSIFGDETSGEAIVIDPGDEIGRITAILEKHQLRVKAIIVTHAHIDHIGGAQKLKALTGAPVYMNFNDQGLYDHIDMQAQWLGVPTPEKTGIDVNAREGESVKLGPAERQASSKCWTRPGTRRAASACGFRRRTNWWPAIRCSWIASGERICRAEIRSQILRSIHDKLLPLDDAVVVIPGHGPNTTIGRERREEPFPSGTVAGWLAYPTEVGDDS